jgi:hypothetical protein
MLVDGHNYKTAAAELKLSVNTVAFYMKASTRSSRSTPSPSGRQGPAQPAHPMNVPRTRAHASPRTFSRVIRSRLALTWGSSCAATDTDYEVYEGALALPFAYNHTEKLCTTGGATTSTIASPVGNVYFLIVPRNAASEGSYGRASNGAERPVGIEACLP